MPNNDTLFRVELSPKAETLLLRLQDRPGLGQSLARGMDAENFATVAAIKQKINGSAVKGLRGSQVLHRRTGRLVSSIGNTQAVVSLGGHGPVVRSAVGSGVGSGSESVRYAAIHEFGGTIHIPSRPTRSKGPYGKKHPNTRAYDVTMPERSYIRSTYNDRKQRYTVRASRSIINFLNGENN